MRKKEVEGEEEEKKRSKKKKVWKRRSNRESGWAKIGRNEVEKERKEALIHSLVFLLPPLFNLQAMTFYAWFIVLLVCTVSIKSVCWFISSFLDIINIL